MLSKDLQGLYEAYKGVYEETDSITDALVEEVIEELFEECVAEGYTLDEAAVAIEEAATEYLMELNPYAPAGSKEARSYAKSTSATKRGVERKAAVKGAVERVKAKAKGIKAAAGIAGSIAKDEARRAGRAAVQSVKSGVEKKKEQVKSGIKGFLGKAAKKVASKASSVAARLGEEVEQLDELKAANDKNVQRVVNARNRRFDRSTDSGAPNREFYQAWRSNRLAAKRNERKGSNVKVSPNLSTEEVDTWDVVLEYLITNGHADTNDEALYIMSQLDEEMVQSIIEGSYEDRIAANNKNYDRNRKRAAQRAAERNAARDAGQTGAVPGVGYVTPRRERETYTDSSGKTRHAKGL